MDDLFKKFINTGVGLLSQSNKALQAAVEKLVKESKLSEQEGKKIVDDLLKNTETKRADLEKQLKGLADDLRTRVVGNEKAASAGKAKAPKPAAKKPAASASGTGKKTAAKAGAAKQAPAASEAKTAE